MVAAIGLFSFIGLIFAIHIFFYGYGRMDKLLIANKSGEQYYGLYRYGSFFTASKEKDKELRIHTNLVYSFKKHNKHIGRIKESVECAKRLLNCQNIVIVPSSQPRPNALQAMFGCNVYTRTKAVESRKYNHKADINEREQLACLTCNYETLQDASTILLVDDIITSGKTMLYFRNLLLNRGYNVIMFGLGLRDTLKPLPTEYTYEIPELSSDEVETLLDDDLYSVPINKQFRVTCHSEDEIDLINYKIKHDYAPIKRPSKLAQLLNLELSLHRLQAKLDLQDCPDSDLLDSKAKTIKLLVYTRINL